MQQKARDVRQWRERQAAKTAGTGIVVQIINYGIRAAVIPLSLRLLGVERYGLWLATGSLMAWGGLADLGLSTGLVNALAKASGQGDMGQVRRHISTALAAYGVIAAALVGVALLVANWSGLPRFLGAANNPTLAADARLLVAVCGIVFAVSIWTQSFSTICSGLQEGYFGTLPVLAGNVVGLVLLVILVWRGASVLSYALAILLPPLAAQLGLACFIFRWRHPQLLPSWRLCDRHSLRLLFAIGGPMAFDQLASIGILYSANVLVANRLSAGAVPHYAIPYSLFALVNGAAYLMANSYMPAYAEASGSADWVWIRRRAFRSLYTTMVMVAVINTVLILVAKTVITTWAGRALVPSLGFLIALACFGLFRTYSETNGVLLVGLGMVRTKAALQLGVAAVMVSGGWLLLPSLGLSSIPMVGSLGFALSGALALPCALRLLSKRERDVEAVSTVSEIRNTQPRWKVIFESTDYGSD